MDEILEIVNKTLEQLNKFIQEEIENTSTEETDILDARLNTLATVLDTFSGSNQRLILAYKLRTILTNFVRENLNDNIE